MISIASAIRRHAARQPSKTAIVTPNEKVTYQQLDADASALAEFLGEDNGSGRVIGSIAGITPTALTIIVGARFANIPLVLLDSKMPSAEVLERCTAMEVRTVVTDSTAPNETRMALENAGIQVVDASNPDSLGGGATGRIQLSASDNTVSSGPIWHAPSGGSSGVRRAIALSESASLFRFGTQTVEFGLDRSLSFMVCSPLIHGGGRSFAIGQLHGGGTVELHAKFDVEATLDALSRVDGAFLVPTMLSRLVESPTWVEMAPKTSATLIVTGGRLDDELAARASKGYRGRIFNYFGSTEAGSVSIAEYENGVRNSTGDLGQYSMGCSGKLLATTEGHGFEDSIENQGKLSVATPGNCLWSFDIATGKKVLPVDGYWDHGDIVKVHDDGSLQYVGRADDMIVSGGVNVYPAEVVGELERSQGVTSAVVVACPDSQWGEIVGAVVEGTPDLSLEGLRTELRTRLRPTAIPKSLVIMDTIPRNAMAKTDGGEIRRLLQSIGLEWRDQRAGVNESTVTQLTH